MIDVFLDEGKRYADQRLLVVEESNLFEKESEIGSGEEESNSKREELFRQQFMEKQYELQRDRTHVNSLRAKVVEKAFNVNTSEFTLVFMRGTSFLKKHVDTLLRIIVESDETYLLALRKFSEPSDRTLSQRVVRWFNESLIRTWRFWKVQGDIPLTPDFISCLHDADESSEPR